MILENLGFRVREKGEQLELIKYGSVQGQLPLSEMSQKAKAYQFDKSRATQLKAILDRYSKIYNSRPLPLYEPSPEGKVKKQIGYRSDLADFIKDKFGVEFVFHGKNGKPPYGYSIVDQSNKFFPYSDFLKKQKALNLMTERNRKRLSRLI
jgi:hypothetical protein